MRIFSVKNVVMVGFGQITLLDLDTIDLSNLNRQFLFRKKDVKQSKALVRSQHLCGLVNPTFASPPTLSRFLILFCRIGRR